MTIFRIWQLSKKIKTCFVTGLCWKQNPCIQQLCNATEPTFVAIVNHHPPGQFSFHCSVNSGDMATSSTSSESGKENSE